MFCVLEPSSKGLTQEARPRAYQEEAEEGLKRRLGEPARSRREDRAHGQGPDEALLQGRARGRHRLGRDRRRGSTPGRSGRHDDRTPNTRSGEHGAVQRK